MDVAFFLVVALAVLVGLWRLLRWSHWQDKRDRPAHEAIPDKEQRSQIDSLFDAIVDPIRKFRPGE